MPDISAPRSVLPSFSGTKWRRTRGWTASLLSPGSRRGLQWRSGRYLWRYSRRSRQFGGIIWDAGSRLLELQTLILETSWTGIITRNDLVVPSWRSSQFQLLYRVSIFIAFYFTFNDSFSSLKTVKHFLPRKCNAILNLHNVKTSLYSYIVSCTSCDTCPHPRSWCPLVYQAYSKTLPGTWPSGGCPWEAWWV